MSIFNRTIALGFGLAVVLATFGALAQDPPTAPAEGASPRVDAIRKAGVLRVGVLANVPWLVENTTGSGPQWSGPAWLLASEYAELLGVEVEAVPVSNETRIPVLASNQVDMTITALAQTPERLKVVDFVIYSQTSVCMFGRADNPNFAAITSVDQLNDPKFVIAYITGGGEEPWIKERFANAELHGITGASSTAPIEEIMAKRADAVAINRVTWPSLNKKVKGLKVLPSENNCQDSTEKAAPVGLAVDKGQDVYLEWLRAVAASMEADLLADERRIVDSL